MQSRHSSFLSHCSICSNTELPRSHIFLFKIIYFYLKAERESIFHQLIHSPQCLQWPGLGQAKGRNLELNACLPQVHLSHHHLLAPSWGVEQKASTSLTGTQIQILQCETLASQWPHYGTKCPSQQLYVFYFFHLSLSSFSLSHLPLPFSWSPPVPPYPFWVCLLFHLLSA